MWLHTQLWGQGWRWPLLPALVRGLTCERSAELQLTVIEQTWACPRQTTALPKTRGGDAQPVGNGPLWALDGHTLVTFEGTHGGGGCTPLSPKMHPDAPQGPMATPGVRQDRPGLGSVGQRPGSPGGAGRGLGHSPVLPRPKVLGGPRRPAVCTGHGQLPSSTIYSQEGAAEGPGGGEGASRMLSTEAHVYPACFHVGCSQVEGGGPGPRRRRCRARPSPGRTLHPCLFAVTPARLPDVCAGGL